MLRRRSEQISEMDTSTSIQKKTPFFTLIQQIQQRPAFHGIEVCTAIFQSRISLICRIGVTLVKLGISPRSSGPASAIPLS